MSRTRPFLTGAAISAAAMYFSLQYHVVRSEAGIRILPRTPQHSLALAWADVRTWTPSQWTDRVELARAAMAAGASDLIADSVRVPLQQEVSESASTLNELRDFLNRTRQDARQSLDKFTEVRRPELPSDPLTSGILAPEPATPQDEFAVAGRGDADLSLDHEESSIAAASPLRQSVPLPADAAVGVPADPFRSRSGEGTTGRPSRFSAEDIRRGIGAAAPSVVPNAVNSLLQQAEEMERKIFGDVSGKASVPIQPNAETPRRMAADLEQSARNLLDQLGKTGAAAATETADDKPWIRSPAAGAAAATDKSAAAPAKPAPDSGESPAPATVEDEDAGAVFDPFLEADSR